MTNFRSGIVALVGRPNVGKSTLINALTGQKVAIVTPKPQTTRTRLSAVVNREGGQMVLVDTPGLTRGVDALRKAMQRLARDAVNDADLSLVLTEVQGDKPRLAREDLDVIARARRGGGDVVVAINKVDKLGRKELLLPWIESFVRDAGIETVVPISAKTGNGLDRLEAELFGRLPEGPPLFPEDMVTDQAERFLCAELVREQMLLRTRQEVPHAAAVVIEEFRDGREEERPICHLTGRIYVERESQKGIVVGKKGSQIRAISEAAREEMEELLGSRVFLRLTVHVDKNWRQSDRAIERMGYAHK